MAGKYLKPKQTIAERTAAQNRRRQQRRPDSEQSQTGQSHTSSAEPVQSSSAREQDYFVRLSKEFESVDSNYMDYVKKQEPYSQNKTEMKRQFSGMSGVYYRQMMLACIMPLQDGVSKDSLAQCIGAYIGMSLVDKNFKAHVGNMVNGAEYQIMSKLAERQGPDSYAARRAEALQRNMIMHDNGGREPFNAHSAALTKIAMTTRAYSDMRQPGADVEKITKEYNAAIAALHEQIGDDGLSMSAVDREMRMVVGRMSEKNADFAMVFKETNYDGVRRAPYHKDPNNPSQVVWTGEYLDKHGKMFTGGFSPREPLTVDSAAEIKYNMTVDAYYAMRKNGADVGKVQEQYRTAMADFAKLCTVDGLDGQAVDKKLRQMVGQRAAKDPSVNDMFVETAFGLVDKAPGVRDPNNPNRAVWSGEYRMQDGRAFDGSFTPRPPISEDMAAQAKVQLTLRTYDAMRGSGADVKACMQEYKAAMGKLDKQCKVDKLDPNVINQSMRIMVGDLCKDNPAMAAMFKETTYDGVEKAAPFVDGYGNQHWTGEYTQADGTAFNGSFTPRMPHGYKKNLEGVTSAISESFASVQDEHDLHDLMIGYSAAYYQIMQGSEPTETAKLNSHYQSTVVLMQMIMDDGADISKFDDDVMKVFRTAYQAVPQDIVDAYKKAYTSGKNRSHPGRGHEYDVSDVDMSSKGRGADAARRLCLNLGDDSGHSGADYNCS